MKYNKFNYYINVLQIILNTMLKYLSWIYVKILVINILILNIKILILNKFLK